MSGHVRGRVDCSSKSKEQRGGTVTPARPCLFLELLALLVPSTVALGCCLFQESSDKIGKKSNENRGWRTQLPPAISRPGCVPQHASVNNPYPGLALASTAAGPRLSFNNRLPGTSQAFQPGSKYLDAPHTPLSPDYALPVFPPRRTLRPAPQLQTRITHQQC
jgi:hypothetical protein